MITRRRLAGIGAMTASALGVGIKAEIFRDRGPFPILEITEKPNHEGVYAEYSPIGNGKWTVEIKAPEGFQRTTWIPSRDGGAGYEEVAQEFRNHKWVTL